jgi:hypothetical protein
MPEVMREEIVAVVVDLEAVGGPILITLCSVIIDHVSQTSIPAA